MNYGYVPIDEKSKLILKDEVDQENRLFIQLYQHTLLGIDLKGKEVLEVGSGRGGGAGLCGALPCTFLYYWS